MKHLKKFENIRIDGNFDFLDSEVKELHDKIAEMFKVQLFTPLPEKEHRKFFQIVQDEFDAGAGELEEIYKVWLPDEKEVFGVYEAYGPHHALVKCSLDIHSPYPITRKSLKAVKVSKYDIEQEIKDAKNRLAMWTDIN